MSVSLIEKPPNILRKKLESLSLISFFPYMSIKYHIAAET